MDFLDTADASEQFPYPVNITREDFVDVAQFDPDEFLFKNHRYTSLDSLLTDLRSLSKSLNQDLLDLVNNEYTNFIKLGQSIGSCLELIDNLSSEVFKFKASLSQTAADFADSSATCSAVLQHKRSLNLLKNKIKLILLLHEQCVSFETLVALDAADRTAVRLQRKLTTLTTLHLSIGKMYAMIMESSAESQGEYVADFSGENAEKLRSVGINGAVSENLNTVNEKPLQHTTTGSSVSSIKSANGDICYFFDNVVKTKVLALRFEFKSYLDELLAMAKSNTKTYEKLLLSVLHTYRVLGMSSEAIKTLKNRG
ncbi:hypothetical protein JCM33374_g4789 [Metschnikowia sp. JCM 33374]|nr:hypothetical protein JCM33374_g4789 [Metschnikowia sp. JCM 33374]